MLFTLQLIDILALCATVRFVTFQNWDFERKKEKGGGGDEGGEEEKEERDYAEKNSFIIAALTCHYDTSVFRSTLQH